MVFQKKIQLETKKQFEILDITREVASAVKQAGVSTGAVSVFTPHTTAAVKLNHSEPLLMQDIMKMMYHLVPLESNYAHDFFEIRTEIQSNERSNGHAHVKAFLLGSSETIPVTGKKLALGARQSVFFVELDGGRKRECVITVFGE
jgi:secondary thiamine-phosphate synthase enzyme